MKNTFRVRRSAALCIAAALSSGLIVVPATAVAEDVAGCSDKDAIYKVNGGEFTWEFRDTWNSYIHGPIAMGTSETSGNIVNLNEENKDESNYKFTATSGDAESSSQADIKVDGDIHYRGHAHGNDYILDNTFSNFTLKFDNAKATLYSDVKYRSFVDDKTVGPWQDVKQIAITEWALKQPFELKEGTVEFASEGNGKFASDDIVAAFGNFYKRGTKKDYTAPISGNVNVTRECQAPAPAPSEDPKPADPKPSTEAPKPADPKPSTEAPKPADPKPSTEAPKPAPHHRDYVFGFFNHIFNWFKNIFSIFPAFNSSASTGSSWKAPRLGS